MNRTGAGVGIAVLTLVLAAVAFKLGVAVTWPVVAVFGLGFLFAGILIDPAVVREIVAALRGVKPPGAEP